MVDAQIAYFIERYENNQIYFSSSRFKTPLFVIINKYDLNEDMTISIEKKLKDKGIQVSGKISYDETMIHALLEGKTINEFKPHGTIAYKLNRIWETIKKTVYEPKSN